MLESTSNAGAETSAAATAFVTASNDASQSQTSPRERGHRHVVDDLPVAIDIDNLVVRFDQFTAVDHVSLQVRKGELFAFLGPNGAGKSTTIRVLIGCQNPTEGQVLVGGHALPQQLEQVKPIFGYVPDTENHIDEFTGQENLELFANLYKVEDPNRIKEVLAEVELSEAANVAVKNYSKGMRRKLLIAREILHRPQILFLDEPTANLDLHSTALVRGMLRKLSASGTTIFLTTHDMEEVEEICDRAAILCRGKLVALDSPAAFIAKYSESMVQVQYQELGKQVRETYCLEDPLHRDELAKIVRTKEGLRMQSEDFRFDDVFLKITGEVYQ